MIGGFALQSTNHLKHTPSLPYVHPLPPHLPTFPPVFISSTLSIPLPVAYSMFSSSASSLLLFSLLHTPSPLLLFHPFLLILSFILLLSSFSYFSSYILSSLVCVYFFSSSSISSSSSSIVISLLHFPSTPYHHSYFSYFKGLTHSFPTYVNLSLPFHLLLLSHLDSSFHPMPLSSYCSFLLFAFLIPCLLSPYYSLYVLFFNFLFFFFPINFRKIKKARDDFFCFLVNACLFSFPLFLFFSISSFPPLSHLICFTYPLP